MKNSLELFILPFFSTADQKSWLAERIIDPGVLESITISVAELVSQNKDGKLPCNYCRANEYFDNELDVLEHIQNMHPVQCPHCPMKMFKYPTSVRKHFKKFHRDETPYFCKTCTLVFTDEGAAQYHNKNEHVVPDDNIVSISMTQTRSLLSTNYKLVQIGLTCIGKNIMLEIQLILNYLS